MTYGVLNTVTMADVEHAREAIISDVSNFALLYLYITYGCAQRKIIQDKQISRELVQGR